jgi:hypothetical protein
MECRTCHHEHPKNEADEDGRPYSDPNFCIARLSERLQHNKEVADQAMKDREAAIVERDALRAQVLSNCVQNLPADSTLVKTEYWEAMKLQNDELKGLLLQVLRDHDRGHSPCTCVEIRGHATKASAAQKRNCGCRTNGDSWVFCEAHQEAKVCVDCGWNNDANHGGGSRVMHTFGKITRCAECLPISR